MSFLYLLDTNILSETLKLQPNSQVLNAIKTHTLEITTTAITIQEIIFGYSCLPQSKRREQIEKYCQKIQHTMPILSYSLEAGVWHGTERARLKQSGIIPPFIDGQIAAMALVHPNFLPQPIAYATILKITKRQESSHESHKINLSTLSF